MSGSSRLVVDGSAVADAVLRADDVGDVVRSLLASSQCHAPHLIDAELGSVLRRVVLRGELRAEVAAERLTQALRLVDVRHELAGPLTDMAWRLRRDVAFYDALYVGLAIILDRPLLTSDAKLAVTARQYVKVLLLNWDGVAPEAAG